MDIVDGIWRTWHRFLSPQTSPFKQA